MIAESPPRASFAHYQREKAREKAAAARTAQSNARSTALLSASASQSPAGTGEGVDGAPAEAPAAVVVSPKMNEGFAALIAQAKVRRMSTDIPNTSLLKN